MATMQWDRLLRPSLVLGGTILDLTPTLIAHHDLKGLILDVDETLVPLREQMVSEPVVAWVESIRPQVALWLVSNNLSQSRIGGIAQSLNLPYILGARKPSRRKLREAVAAMDLPPATVAMVGDRLFTDALAGNRLGLFTILVEPMVDPTAAQSYPIRNFEVWLSHKLGVTLHHPGDNFR